MVTVYNPVILNLEFFSKPQKKISFYFHKIGKGKGTRNVNLKLTGSKIKMETEVNSITANISKSQLAAYNTIEVTGSENDITASKAIINGNKNDIRASKIDLKGNVNTIIDTNHRSTASHLSVLPIVEIHTGPDGISYTTTTYKMMII